MLYELLVPLARYHTAFNVFRYITFRTAMATVTALVISFIMGPWLINRLREMQHGGSSVREDTPERHQKTKAGTPTMGGIGILIALLASTLLWANLRNRYVWVLVLATAGLGLIGLRDDWKKVRTRKGISAREKFGAQILLVGLLMAWLYVWPTDGFTTSVVIPFFKGWLLTFGWLWIPFAILVVVGSSNAVNLTDGLDGLAIGPIVTAGGAFAVIAYLTGNFRAAEYLRILNVKGTGELTIFCGALVGAALGFLWFNSYPAQVFMGDVGSLALGLPRHPRGADQVGVAAAADRRHLRGRGGVGHHPGGFLQDDGAARLPHGAPPSSLRDQGVGGAQDHREVLDRVHHAGAPGPHHLEAPLG